MPIHEDELRDAENAARKHGYDADTLTFQWVEYPSLQAGPRPVVADVQVMDTQAGIEKTYQAGDGTAWPIEFAADLARGVYGVLSGQREVRPWRVSQWVQVRAARPDGETWAVTDENEQTFEIRARSDAEFRDAIIAELRRRYPRDE